MDSFRFVICARSECGQVFFLCRWCDHGDRYCDEECAKAARRASLRDAGRRYQRSREGAQGHADRQRTYREKVTHQGLEEVSASVDVVLPLLAGATAAPETLGVRRAILYDNLKSVVLERHGDHIRFHLQLLEFAGHYHFAPRPCAPYRG